MTPRLKGKIEKGEIIYNDEELKNKHIASLEGKEISIVIKKWTNNRTGLQNRYYWKYLSLIADETGDNPNSLHEAFKRMFLPPKFEYIKFLNRSVKVPTSTTTLSTIEMANYMKEIEIKTDIPMPDIDRIEI